MLFSRIKSLPSKIYNYALQRYNCLAREEILVLGDSHANVFTHKDIQSFFLNYTLNVVSVGGATVSGLQNPNSKTQALPIFMRRIKKSKAKTIIILLGEVDTGFVIWYRAEKYQAPVDEMLESALRNYQNLLSQLSKTHRIICISTPLPTIRDGQDWGEIANARKDIKATQLQRTKLTIQFNIHMQSFCQESGISYLNFDNISINKNGVVDTELINKNDTDHHYNQDVYAAMIINELKGCIESSKDKMTA